MSSNNTILKSSIVTASKNNLSSELDGEMVILDRQSGVYFGLNSVGASIWNLIVEPKKVVDIRDTIAALYQVDSERCENDVLQLLEELAAEGLIEVQNETVV